MAIDFDSCDVWPTVCMGSYRCGSTTLSRLRSFESEHISAHELIDSPLQKRPPTVKPRPLSPYFHSYSSSSSLHSSSLLLFSSCYNTRSGQYSPPPPSRYRSRSSYAAGGRSERASRQVGGTGSTAGSDGGEPLAFGSSLFSCGLSQRSLDEWCGSGERGWKGRSKS